MKDLKIFKSDQRNSSQKQGKNRGSSNAEKKERLNTENLINHKAGLSAFLTMNETDDGIIPSSYTLSSDNSLFVTQSFVFDYRLVSNACYLVIYVSFALSVFVLAQSSYLNRRKMNFVRFCAGQCLQLLLLCTYAISTES